jgi:hypothetical protein
MWVDLSKRAFAELNRWLTPKTLSRNLSRTAQF